MAVERVPDTDDSELRVYKLAFQKEEGQPLELYTFREVSTLKVILALKKLADIKVMGDLSFVEIHEIMPGGVINVVYGDMLRDWPKVKANEHGYVIRGKKEDGTSVLDKYNVGSSVMDSGPNHKAAADYKAEMSARLAQAVDAFLMPIEQISNVRPMKFRIG